MKITFIEPKPYFAGWTFGWLKTLPLLGQVYLATILKNKGHDIEIYKETVKSFKISDLKDSDVICFSAISSQATRAKYLLKKLKKIYPEKKYLVGGVHASFRPEDFREADHVVIGEGENVIADLIEGKYKEWIVKGTPVENLDALPFPDFSLIKGLKIPMRYTPISTSRGCPFDCSFCTATKMFGKKYRFRSPESIIQEMKTRKTKNFLFYDDNFFANKERAKKILRLMIENNITSRWWAEGRVDIAHDEELLELISKTNHIEIAIGFESINPKVLKSFSKSQRLEDIIHCIKKLKEHNIRIKGFFIGGADEDDSDVFEKICKFVEEQNFNTATYSVLTPFPGTVLFENLKKQGRILTEFWGAYDTQHVVFKPKIMSASELQSKQYKAIVWDLTKKRTGLKFWLNNLGDTFNMLKELRRGIRVNTKFLNFLKKADSR